jgi:hypothetical protein
MNSVLQRCQHCIALPQRRGDIPSEDQELCLYQHITLLGERLAHIWWQMLEYSDSTIIRCGLVTKDKADFDYPQDTRGDECVAEKPMNLSISLMPSWLRLGDKPWWRS